MAHRVYFSYGSNMDIGQMRDRCPNSTVLGPAVLPDHGFRIAVGGYATVVPEPGASVHGVLWHLTAEDELALDRYEDLDAGLYHKVDLEVVDADGRVHRAMAYLATDATVGRPVEGYLEKIIEAAFHHRFPVRYVESLRTWLNAGQARP